LANTTYKVGDKLYGTNRSFYLKVERVYGDGDIEVSFKTPSGNRKFYSFKGSPWTTLPSRLRINGTGNFGLKVETDDYQYTWDGWRWFGNKSGSNQMRYGRNPYNFINKGSQDGPRWQGSDTFVKDCGRNPNTWEVVSGTYKWANKTSQGDWSGWIKGNYQGVIKNDYARPVTAKLKLKNPKVKSTTSGTIKINALPPSITILDGKNKNYVIPENPGTYERPKAVKVTWKEDTTNFTYTVSNTTFRDIDGNKSNITMKNGTTLSEFGTYTITVTCENKVSKVKDSSTCTIEIVDPVPPPAISIFDNKVKTIKYDMSNKVFLGPCYPTITVPANCEVTTSVIDGSSYTLASELVENKTYNMKVVVRKTTNNLTSAASAIFTIDNTPPKAPIIHIDKDYQGRDFGLVGYFPNPVSPTITAEPGCQIYTKVYYKKDAKATEWTQITEKQTYSDKGIYRIESRAKKLTNGLYSDYTIVQFYKKIKYRFTITLSPNDLCYRTIATVNFPEDPTLKCFYKIDDGEWRWYRDPVKIYKNCIIYVKSQDGDDGYESYITSKIVDIIDTEDPSVPVIKGVSEGDVKQVVTPTAE
jgi:hypothetical protein